MVVKSGPAVVSKSYGRGGAGTPFSVYFKTHVRTNKGGVWSAIQDTSLRFGRGYAELVKMCAQENVAPGRGPGPHPHPGRTDTAYLQASIVTRQAGPGSGAGGSSTKWFVGVFSDRKATPPTSMAVGGKPWVYGMALEFGFKVKGGRRVRYPWMTPAIKRAASLARSKVQKSWCASGLFLKAAGR